MLRLLRGAMFKRSRLSHVRPENEIVYFRDWLIYISALFALMPMARAQERGTSNAPHHSA
jgi:hypothetical protein